METRPTRARYRVIAFAVALAVLAYIDRVAISQAAAPISRDLGLSKSQMGLIFGAFALAYALFEIPSGWMGDRIGPRAVLIRIVLAWSAFTALTGFAWNFRALWVTRFLFGAGEAGCFPNLTKAFSLWIPPSERARAQGIVWAFARWGGAFTPPLVVFAFHFMNWRAAFVSFGTLGLVWCFLFYRWFRDRPSDHPSVNAAELQLIGTPDALHVDVPWRKLMGHRSVWLLCIQYFCVSFGWYFYITWLPTYLQEFRGLDAAHAARLAVLPLLFGGFGSLVSGIDHAQAHHRDHRHARRGLVDLPGHENCLADRRDARHGRRQLRERPRGSRRVACLHGHRRKVFGDGFGRHEHAWQPGRIRRARLRRIPARSHARKLEFAFVRDGRRLRCGCGVLAVH